MLRMLPPRSWNSGRFAARYAMPRLSRPRPRRCVSPPPHIRPRRSTPNSLRSLILHSPPPISLPPNRLLWSMNPLTVSPLPKPVNLPPRPMPPLARISRLSRISPSPLELNHRLRCVMSVMSATMPLPTLRRNWSAYALPEHWMSSIWPPRRISSPSLWAGNITPTTLRKAWRSSRPVRCPRRNLSNPQWRKS